VYYSRNITPDSTTGVGAWTDGEIVQAIREGVRKDRRVLFPLMPIDWLNGISDKDALALVAYLRSLPPVRKEIPSAEPSMMARALFAFNVLAPKAPITTTRVAPVRGVTAEYGKYFASHLSGCADCHTPRNLNNGQFYFDSVFAGGSIEFGAPEGHPLRSYASNLRAVLGNGTDRWSEEDFVGAVTSGMRADGTVLDPHMPYSAFKRLEAEDIKAMYLFLGSLERIPRVVPPSRYASRVLAARGSDRGKLLFESRCAPCHGVEGKGAAPTAVKLAEVSASISDTDFMDFVLKGQPNLKMPSFGKTFSSEEVRDLVAFIRTWERH
jgi:mono/diheme cytochrome c family protein